MGATMPQTVGYSADVSARVMMHSGLVLSGTSNTSTFTQNFAALPPSSTPWLQKPAGILNRNFFDPNFYVAQGTDPTTVNGVVWAAPYTGVGVGKAMSVVIGGITYVYAHGGALAAGDWLFLADQYGRVDNAANLSIAAGTLAFAVGRAQQASAATANLLVAIAVQIVPYNSAIS